MITILIFLIVLIVLGWMLSSTSKAFADRVRNGDWGRLAVAGIALAVPVVYYLIYGLN